MRADARVESSERSRLFVNDSLTSAPRMSQALPKAGRRYFSASDAGPREIKRD